MAEPGTHVAACRRDFDALLTDSGDMVTALAVSPLGGDDAEVSAVATCRQCGDGLLHCHGVLVLHRDGEIQCLDDPSCPGEVLDHAFTASCLELLETCCR